MSNPAMQLKATYSLSLYATKMRKPQWNVQYVKKVSVIEAQRRSSS